MNDTLPPLLDVDSLSFIHPTGRGKLDKLTFRVERGEFVLITGASGSGKSTLLRLLAGLETQQSGDIRLFGTSMQDMNMADLRHTLGFVTQTPLIDDALDIRDNLLLPFTFRANKTLPRPTDGELSDSMHRLGLDNIALTEAAGNLSIGQKQRLSIIRAVLLHPSLLLLDEPTSALDPESSSIVEQHLETLAAAGTGIICITHQAYSPTRPYRTLHLEDGHARWFENAQS